MTKADIIHYMLQIDTKDLGTRLDKLMDEDRITSGARYYVYSPHDNHGIKSILEIIDKASKSKNYTRYIKRIDHWTIQYYMDCYNKHLAKIEAFVTEQENLPFEQTQKQLLIQGGS